MDKDLSGRYEAVAQRVYALPEPLVCAYASMSDVRDAKTVRDAAVKALVNYVTGSSMPSQ